MSIRFRRRTLLCPGCGRVTQRRETSFHDLRCRLCKLGFTR